MYLKINVKNKKKKKRNKMLPSRPSKIEAMLNGRDT